MNDDDEHLRAFQGAIAGCAVGVAIWVMGIAGCVSLTSCFAIPVRAVPTDEPILVAPVGVEQTQGDGATALNPHLPQPDPNKFPPAASTTIGWSNVLNIALMALFGVGLPVGVRHVSKLKQALRITADLADGCAAAETDADVERAKRLAAQIQESAGVRSLTNKVRGKRV